MLYLIAKLLVALAVVLVVLCLFVLCGRLVGRLMVATTLQRMKFELQPITYMR